MSLERHPILRWLALVAVVLGAVAVAVAVPRSPSAAAPTTALALGYDGPTRHALLRQLEPNVSSVLAMPRDSRPGVIGIGRALLVAGVAAEAGTSGGAAAVRLGQAGEDAVRGAYDIGPKFTADFGEHTRIFDGLSNEAVSEVKNVASQAYTQQLKDSLAYAQGNGLRFDLYVRPDTYLTGPLRDAISGGFINLRYIP